MAQAQFAAAARDRKAALSFVITGVLRSSRCCAQSGVEAENGPHNKCGACINKQALLHSASIISCSAFSARPLSQVARYITAAHRPPPSTTTRTTPRRVTIAANDTALFNSKQHGIVVNHRRSCRSPLAPASRARSCTFLPCCNYPPAPLRRSLDNGLRRQQQRAFLAGHFARFVALELTGKAHSISTTANPALRRGAHHVQQNSHPIARRP